MTYLFGRPKEAPAAAPAAPAAPPIDPSAHMKGLDARANELQLKIDAIDAQMKPLVARYKVLGAKDAVNFQRLQGLMSQKNMVVNQLKMATAGQLQMAQSALAAPLPSPAAPAASRGERVCVCAPHPLPLTPAPRARPPSQ